MGRLSRAIAGITVFLKCEFLTAFLIGIYYYYFFTSAYT